MKPNIAAVITGDIINSAAIQNKEALMLTLKQIFASITEHANTHCQFEIYRGDSFQALIPDAMEAWKIALLIRAGLRSSPANEKTARAVIGKNKNETAYHYPIQTLWDARVSIGIGEISYQADRVAESHGEGFERSGLGINQLEVSKECLIVNSIWPDLNERFKLVAYLIDEIIKGWSRNAAEIIFKSLLTNIKQEQLAIELGISQSAVNQRLNAAQWTGIYTSVTHYQFELAKCLTNNDT